MKTLRILLVVTSADRIGPKSQATGAWLDEVAAPYFVFKDTKCEITLASPKGGPMPIDPESHKPEHVTAATRRLEADANAMSALIHTKPLSEIQEREFDAVFFAGGHGTMVDFPADSEVIRLVEAFYAANKPVASVCHGPACLVHAKKPDGSSLIAGHRFTCFSNAEEAHIGFTELMPFALESRLNALGGAGSFEPLFAANVVQDGLLLTGQNPASSIPLAEAVVANLRQRTHRRDAA